MVRPALHMRQRQVRAQARAARPCRPHATCARPSAATGVYALECAMDELAVALKLDPLELRLRCYSERDQNDGSALQQQGAARMLPPGRGGVRLGQAQSRAALDAGRQRPGRLGHGDRRLGSVAGADHRAHRADRQRHMPRSRAPPPTSAPAPTPSWRRSRPTCWGCRSTAFTIKLGDSTLPQSPVEGGSWIAASVVERRSRRRPSAIREELLRLAQQHAEFAAWPVREPGDVTLADGMIVSRNDAPRRCRSPMRCGMAASTASSKKKLQPPRTTARTHSNTHSAIFAEVKVDEQLGVIRVTRVVSAVAAGRILNTKTARSQILGGVVWGIGMALHEETLIDHQFGRYHECQYRRIPCSGERGRARHQGHLRRRAGRQSIRSASRAWARSASSAFRRRSPTRSITRPANACATCRSRSISYSTDWEPSSH